LKLRYAYAALALLTLGAFGCGKKDAAVAEDTLATVNGEKISTKDFVDFLASKQTVYVNAGQGPQLAQAAQPIGFQALQDLINKKVILQLAKDQGVLPTDADVSKELDLRTAQQGDFIQTMTRAGLTLEQIKADLMFDLARERLITKGVIVTPAEVDSYIKENPKAFTEPAKASLLYVAVGNSTKKAQVDKDLSGGASFQTVATRYSEDPQARETGGQYPISDESQMPPQLQAIVDKTAPLKASDWVSVGQGFVKFYVQSKTPAKPVAITPELKERVRRNLAVQRGQLSTDLGKKQSEKMQAAQITVSQPMLSKMWESYMDSMKKQSAASSPPAGGGTGAPTAPGAPAPGKPEASGKK